MSAVVNAVLAVPFGILDFAEGLYERFEKIRDAEYSRMLLFAGLFFTYFLVASGIIYDIIVEPPSIGQDRDPNTGMTKPQAILPYRINGQYMIEGFAAGLFYCLGGIGFILANSAMSSSTAKKGSASDKYIKLFVGAVLGCIAYFMCNLFIRIKMPGYGITY
uniref:Oligosaccharyltransferase complex subunit n=1 Tax=Palpitomonas bilix TaxID=652834 RepID=A0A7S3G4B6_9EUKA|mmetsp:Transcript_25303/g.63495  ORF Transcript_25303/g.63495 Transcript_25303/m.63495 type:complete len:162 (+) Transcript_25303:62-547(+)